MVVDKTDGKDQIKIIQTKILIILLVVIKENDKIKISMKIIGTGIIEKLMMIILIDVIQIVGPIEEEMYIQAEIEEIDTIEVENQARTIITININKRIRKITTEIITVKKSKSTFKRFIILFYPIKKFMRKLCEIKVSLGGFCLFSVYVFGIYDEKRNISRFMNFNKSHLKGGNLKILIKY